MNHSKADDPMIDQDKKEKTKQPPHRSRMFRKANMLLRRVHLYLGLFLLPWVLLYGATAALFNHHSWFPDANVVNLKSDPTSHAISEEFPSAAELADQIVSRLRQEKPDSQIALDPKFTPEFTGPIAFETRMQQQKLTIEIDPVSFHSAAHLHDSAPNTQTRIWNDLSHLPLNQKPISIAKQFATQSLNEAFPDQRLELWDLGWSKLNFIAIVDQQPVRITYVLRDEHLDAFEFTGQNDMTLRQFLLRLHTSHGYSPHHNYRFFWSLIVDVMAFAMLTWAVTGITMWWQIRRARKLGLAVILISVVTAVLMYLGMSQFYAQTLL